MNDDWNAPDKTVTVSGTASTNDVEERAQSRSPLIDDDDPLAEVTLTVTGLDLRGWLEGRRGDGDVFRRAPEDFMETVSIAVDTGKMVQAVAPIGITGNVYRVS